MNSVNKNNIPSVVIFGRANVGKSTLFNRLTEKQKALVSSTPGTTRDAHEQTLEWNGIFFNLVDTGGIIEKINKEKSNINKQVQKQATSYLKNADIILFLTDIKEGLLPTDKSLAIYLKKNFVNKQIILTANKADTFLLRQQAAEFNKLGMGEPLVISAATGSGTGDLLDKIISILKKQKKNLRHKPIIAENHLRICLVGKPNVGKSSLLNAMLNEEKVIVSSRPHTTREPNNFILKYKNYDLELIDTAGLSRQGQKYVKNKKNKNSLEKLSIKRTIDSLAYADIAVLLIDISKEPTLQETKIVDAIIHKKIGLIIAANKWDLIKKRDSKHYSLLINQRLPFVKWAPIVFISAKNKKNIKNLLAEIIYVGEVQKKTINENQLDKFLKQSIKKHRPSKSKGIGRTYIHRLKQTGVNPLRFTIYLGSRDSIQKSYLKYLENSLRKKFSLKGASLSIHITKKRKNN